MTTLNTDSWEHPPFVYGYREGFEEFNKAKGEADITDDPVLKILLREVGYARASKGEALERLRHAAICVANLLASLVERIDCQGMKFSANQYGGMQDDYHINSLSALVYACDENLRIWENRLKEYQENGKVFW